MLLVPHGLMLLVPFRKGGWGVSCLFPMLFILFFSSLQSSFTHLAGCPSYLQYLVLALSCNLFILGWHTHVPLHVWLSHQSVKKYGILVHFSLGPKQTSIYYTLSNTLTKFYFPWVIQLQNFILPRLGEHQEYFGGLLTVNNIAVKENMVWGVL